MTSRPQLVPIFLLSLAVSVFAQSPTTAPARYRPPLQLSAADRALISAALAPQHSRYDPAERMTRSPFSSPGYHTTLTGGFVHSTRGSLEYAVACLDTGDDTLRERAEQILRRLVSLQDQDPASKTYGIWSWFLEEPLEKMSPPDWNWADFCGHQLLQVALDHRARLPKDLVDQVDAAIKHAARSIQRRNVGPGYTNIAILGTYVTMLAAEMYDIPDLREYARGRLQRLHEYTLRHGAFTEYNSPTYTIVSLRALSQLRTDIRDPQSLKLIDDLHRLAWEEIAFHFHAPTRQWAGPHSRCYRTLLGDSVPSLIQRATENRVNFGVKPTTELDQFRVRLECPRDLDPFFTELNQPRMRRQTVSKDAPPIIASTYLHPAFAIGSINRGDLWNQRRALLAYWGSARKPSYLHVRFLHDGYDFSAAQFFSAQREGRVLAGINFATDGGDTHVSLDRIKNATIRAKDLRLRFEFGGAAASADLTAPANVSDPIDLAFDNIRLRLGVPYARWNDFPGRWQAGRDKTTAFLDLVLYSGPEQIINLANTNPAALALTVELSPGPIQTIPASPRFDNGQLKIDWQAMTLTLPTRPDRAGALQRASRK